MIGLRFPAAWVGVFVAEGTMFSWLRFLRISPLGVCIMYDRGVFAMLTVLAVV